MNIGKIFYYQSFVDTARVLWSNFCFNISSNIYFL